ncbi:HNH endonuclease, partial [Lactococcus lactis]
ELHNGFYQDKRWSKVSEYVKARDGYVDAIEGKAWDKGDLIADHIIPRRLLSGMEQYNTDNLWLLTKSQHNKKTAIENKLSDQQLKNVGRDWWKKVLKNKK